MHELWACTAQPDPQGSAGSLQVPRVMSCSAHIRWACFCRYHASQSVVQILQHCCRSLGIKDEDLLIARPRSGVLKPSYFLLYDHRMSSVVLLVRGTQSVKVCLRLTACSVRVRLHHLSLIGMHN